MFARHAKQFRGRVAMTFQESTQGTNEELAIFMTALNISNKRNNKSKFKDKMKKKTIKQGE